MALDAVNERVKENGAKHLLDLLPNHESMRWVSHPGAKPPKALVIGMTNKHDVLAFCMQFGDKPREIRYCLNSKNLSVNPAKVTALLQDDVVDLPLIAPFKYNAGSSKAEKRRFSIIIKYYFLLSGAVQDSIGGDIADYCKRFIGALQKIQSAEQEMNSPEKPEKEDGRGTRAAARAAIENPGQLRSRNTASSNSDDNADRSTNSPTPAPPIEILGEPESDYIKLKNYLGQHNSLWLLRNLPEPDEVQFAPQKSHPSAQPKKLFIGKHAKTGEDIYAYMRKSRAHHHEIRFFIESNDSSRTERPVNAEIVGHQNILHPFNKTYPKNTETLEQMDKSRLTLMVKWYFLAAGIARNIVLRETKDFPYRLRTALEYIANRMGEASVQPPLPQEPPTAEEAIEEDSQISENLIQSDLCANQSSTSQSLSPQASRVAQRAPAPATTPRGTKRTAEDSDFNDLRSLLEEDGELSEKIDQIDQQVEMMEIQLQNMLEQKERLDGERREVRRRFKRRSLVVARSPS